MVLYNCNVLPTVCDITQANAPRHNCCSKRHLRLVTLGAQIGQGSTNHKANILRFPHRDLSTRLCPLVHACIYGVHVRLPIRHRACEHALRESRLYGGEGPMHLEPAARIHSNSRYPGAWILTTSSLNKQYSTSASVTTQDALSVTTLFVYSINFNHSTETKISNKAKASLLLCALLDRELSILV